MRRDYGGLRIDLSVLRKCVIVWFPDCVDKQNSGMWSRGLAVAPKYSVPAIKPFFSVFIFADCALENQISTLENWM